MNLSSQKKKKNNNNKKKGPKEKIRWPILQKCPVDFLREVRRFVVVGKNGDDVLMITKDDKVYGVGKNEFNILGLGESGATGGVGGSGQDSKLAEPKEIVELNGKEIRQISNGYFHVLALTKHGDLWAWGRNSDGQCGDGTTVDCSRPKLVIENDMDKIEKIRSGARHNLLMTRAGVVMSWGANNCGQLGLGREGSGGLPKKIEQLARYKVVDIATGSYHSIVLTDKGKVFLWGWNEGGQLGTGDFEDERLPIEVIPRFTFRSIAAGHWHTLLLTRTGHIYAFGSNACGQLGCQTDADKQSVPLMINRDEGMERYRTLYAHSHFSAALAQLSESWAVWGELAKIGFTHQPLETSLESLEHVMADFQKEKSIPRLIHYRHREQEPNPVMQRIGQMFNQSGENTIQLCVGKKTKKPPNPANIIHVHRGFLQVSSPYFERLLSERWRQKETVYINDYPFSVYQAYFKFLYTGQLDTDDLIGTISNKKHGKDQGDCDDEEDETTLSLIISLLDLSNCYLDDELKERCVSLLSERLSTENFSRLYRLAIHYQLPEFQKYILEFVLQNTLRVFRGESHYLLNELTSQMIIDLGELTLVEQ